LHCRNDAPSGPPFGIDAAAILRNENPFGAADAPLRSTKRYFLRLSIESRIRSAVVSTASFCFKRLDVLATVL
jgi:hypothetical protein